MIDQQHTQTINANKSSYLSPMGFFSLDTLPGGNTDIISITTDDNTLIDRWISRYSETLYRAEALYRSVLFVGQVSRFLSWILHKPAHLMDASEIIPDENAPYHFSGWKYVPISRIIASETCFYDFDFAFNPLNDQNRTRWIHVAAVTLLGAEIPPVDLLQVDNTYIVRDGHYRISVAHALGQENIAACITLIRCTS
ncbi:MAG: hypothetical protein P8Z00_12050 [Anaerolineales bacterium]|jgi:hypothetical protein